MPPDNPDAVHLAVRLLARREHSCQELRSKLQARGIEPTEVEQALAEVQAQGMQSDERFAQACTESLLRRGYGSLRVRNELQARGVAEDLAARFVETAGIEDAARAMESLERKSWQSLTREGALRFLSSRGYPAEAARQAVNEKITKPT